MFLSGREIAKFVDVLDGRQVQPAGVDLTVSEVERLVEPGEIDFSNENRKIPEGEKLVFDEKIPLEPGVYRIRYGETVRIPEDCIGILLPRSSLLRMGATVFGALWDPGYEGRGQGLLQVFNPHRIVLHRNARVAQLIFIRGSASGRYGGRYQGEGF